MKIYQRGYRDSAGVREVVGKGVEVIGCWVGQESTASPILEWDFNNPYKPNYLYPKRFIFNFSNQITMPNEEGVIK